jgi:hypothetical protein
MTKASKAAIFVIAASLLNILVTAILFILCLGLYSLTLGKILPQTAVMWAVVGSFVLSLAGSFFFYKKFLSFAQKKYNLDEKLGFTPDQSRKR